MKSTRRLILLIVVFVFCVGCDQTTKSIATSVLLETQTWSYLGDTIRLQLVYNDGGFLSLGTTFPEPLRKAIFTVGVGFFLLFILAYAFTTKPGYPSTIFAVVLIFSGGVGNLIDRIVYDGSVVDFINIGIGPVRTGIFNVADIAITVGVIMLFYLTVPRKKKRGRMSI